MARFQKLSEEQKRSIVADVHARIEGGQSINSSCKQAGAPYGIATSTVRDLCRALGRPVSAQTKRRTAQAIAFRTVYTAERQRELVQRMLAVVAQESDVLAKQREGERNLIDVQRVSNTLGRLVVTDRALLAAFGPGPLGGEAPQEGEQPDGTADHVARWIEQWRKDVAAFSGRADGGEDDGSEDDGP